MTTLTSDLSAFSTDDLVNEILKRREVVCSIWNKEDVTPLIDDDPAFQDLSEETKDELAIRFLNDIRSGLQDILAQRGNSYIDDKWYSTSEDYADEFGSDQ